jgi:hypothetical protein
LALLETAQKNLQQVKDELQVRLDNIEAQRDAFEAAEDAVIALKIEQGKYNDVIAETIRLLKEMSSLIATNTKAAAITGAGGENLNRYVPPVSTAEDEAALEEFLIIVGSLDEAAAAAEAAAEAFNNAADKGDWRKFDELLRKKAVEDARLAEAQAAYDATLPAVDPNFTGSGGGPGGRFATMAMSSGGMVKPKYFSIGGAARGTDTVPAMLTPGEFVMSKYAVNSYGVDKMKAINSGSYEGEKVYNYNLSVNVKSDADPDDIARVVMTQIRQIDSQRIRTQRA